MSGINNALAWLDALFEKVQARPECGATGCTANGDVLVMHACGKTGGLSCDRHWDEYLEWVAFCEGMATAENANLGCRYCDAELPVGSDHVFCMSLTDLAVLRHYLRKDES